MILAEKSRCLEIDSYDVIEKFDTQRNKTNIKATNLTLVNTEDNNQGLVKEAVFVSNESFFSMNNSVIYGFKDFLMVKDIFIIDEFEEYIKLKNIVVGHCDATFKTMKGDGVITGLDNNFYQSKNAILVSEEIITVFFKNPVFSETPDFRYLKMEKNNKRIVTK